MGTRDRIIETARLLFNEEGEGQVTTVDIANEMGISPGNLYYHFRGKGPIIEALFKTFEEEMSQVLTAPSEGPLEVDDTWVFLYIVFEEIYYVQFLYHNLVHILEEYPAIAVRFRRIMKTKQATMLTMIEHLRDEDLIDFTDQEGRALAERMAMQFTWWPAWQKTTDPTVGTRVAIHNGVYSIFSQVAPWLISGRDEFSDLLSKFHARMIAKDN